ncbi:MAG: glycosyltransferase family 1 protein [Undibacterium sp.]|nr:glycosyltransferase family 1 protein [Opitutaceae bacterium]
MPRFVLVTYGSLGDLHPTLALAHELRRRGHEAIVATSESYRARVTAQGLQFVPVRPDLSLANPELVRRVMDGQRGSEYLMRELVFPNIRDMHTDLAAAAVGADFLVASELAYAVPLVAARLNLPWAFFALSPISFLSVHDPVVLPGPAFLRHLQKIGPRTNRFILRVARTASHSWWAPLRALRRELSLRPAASPLFNGKYSPHLNLALFSPLLQAPQPDWPARTHQPGFCFFDELESDATPSPLPAAIATFLAAGPPPIVFTLGSAAVQVAEDFYLHSARAAQLLGRRALLLLGPNPPPPGLPPSILAWDYLPYAQIFPHAAAIVHQGGVGTSAQALRAGRPMVIVPFAHDQFDNAARLTRLGSGRTLARARYTPTSAAQALAALLDDPLPAQLAADHATRLRTERGITAACDALEHALNVTPVR